MALPSPRVLPVLAGCLLAAALPTFGGHVPDGAAAAPRELALNIRDYGAIGDGRVHRLRDSLAGGRRVSLRAVQRQYPFVDSLDWTMDELAFARAKLALPPSGGTIHFPVGHYVTGRHPWRAWRNDLRLTGEGADRTILSTAPGIEDGLSVAPYRHVGWLEGPEREYPFGAASGARGADALQLKQSAWTAEFRRGDLVFVRNGANRFDQDYGEFNEVAGTEPDGRLRFKHALARDYTLPAFNWAAETAADFALPGRGRTVEVALRRGPGLFVPPAGSTVSIGENVFLVREVLGGGSRSPVVWLLDSGQGNDPRGTLVPAGARLGKSRTILKLTQSTRRFRCENLQVIGRRKAVVVSNAYETSFSDCTFVRARGSDATFTGGLTIDGDGGRFARFERCRIIARPPAGMQFARSFGGVVFSGCTFTDANVAFTEFCFDAEVTRCTFDVRGGVDLGSVIIAGKSCGDLRVMDNTVRATAVRAIFDTHSDIQSQKHGSEGVLVVRGNTIVTDDGVRLLNGPRPGGLALEENSVTKR